MDENTLIKLIWTGLSIVGIAFIIMIALILASSPIPGFVAQFFAFGIAVAVITSIALAVIKNKKGFSRHFSLFNNNREA